MVSYQLSSVNSCYLSSTTMNDNKSVRTRARSANEMQSIEEKLDLILSKITQIESDSASFKADINSIKEDTKKFTAEINKTLDFYSEKLTDVEHNLEHTNTKVKIHDENIDTLKSDNISLRQEVSILKKKLNANAQYLKSNCLEIQGVPESKTENVTDLVVAVAGVLGFNMVPTMIDAAHRLAPISGRNGPRHIIVKFCRRFDMEQVRRLAIKKKGFSASNLGFSSDLTVYVNLAMTRETRILWADTRKLKDELRYKFAWITATGKIFLRKSEGDRPVLIEDHSDLQRLRRVPRKVPVTESVKNGESHTDG